MVEGMAFITFAFSSVWVWLGLTVWLGMICGAIGSLRGVLSFAPTIAKG